MKKILVLVMISAMNLMNASGANELTEKEIIESYKLDSHLWIKPHLSEGVEFREIEALPKTPPYPTHNPYSKEKHELGKKLFNDPRLSLSNQIACANCHDEELGFADGRSVSYGHDRQKGRRNAPSITMSAFGVEKFWDGRAKDLEAQAIMPIADPLEMAYNADKAAKKLNQIAEYREQFRGAFGTSEITAELLGKAIATYERGTMRPTRFDRFMRGDKSAMNEKEIYGMHLFRTKARCINCHNGVEFSDGKYHNLGLHFYGREKYEDLGRYEVTKNPADVGAFKTPSLRGVAKTAPYMHNGLFPHLRGVINAYNFGMANPTPKEGRIYNPPFPKSDEILRPLNLSKDEIEALEAFLRVL
ncbi:cytochrome-c peroxidase [Helicobacter sp. 23-1044]